MLEAGSYRYLQQLEGPPAGWWYDRAVPKPLRRSLGRGRVRRFLSQERTEAERRYGEVQEEVQRLLALSSGVLRLRRREVRLVARDCARDWQRQRGSLAFAELPNEADLAELLVNGFSSRGLSALAAGRLRCQQFNRTLQCYRRFAFGFGYSRHHLAPLRVRFLL